MAKTSKTMVFHCPCYHCHCFTERQMKDKMHRPQKAMPKPINTQAHLGTDSLSSSGIQMGYLLVGGLNPSEKY